MNYNLEIDIKLLKKQKKVLVNEAYTLRQSTYPKQQAEGDLYEGIISILDSIQDQYEENMFNRYLNAKRLHNQNNPQKSNNKSKNGTSIESFFH